jgi:release factor glutamine methyltransferase
MKTLLEVLQATADYFAKHGVESPRLNAELLIAHTLGKKRLDLYLEFDRPLGEEELTKLREPVRQRAQGVPLQHLLGSVEFLGREFKCDRRALIPRPETEQLCELLIADRRLQIEKVSAADATAVKVEDAAELQSAISNQQFAILDVGTGSGVIALTLAAQFPNAEVHATDASADALALARENAALLGLAERVTFHQGDLLDGTPGPFNLIVANLPYVANADEPTLARELRHDPRTALFGGERGTEIIERLIADATPHFAPGGLLALETGAGQADYLVDKLRAAGYHDIETKADYQGHQRFLFATYG